MFYERGKALFFFQKSQIIIFKLIVNYSNNVESNCNQQDYMRVLTGTKDNIFLSC